MGQPSSSELLPPGGLSKQEKQSKQEKEKEEKSKDMVVLPYMKSVTEQLKRVFGKHRLGTSVKPHQTICSVLVHPKDKIPKEDQTGVVYKIECKNCNKVYIEETGRKISTRMKEHKTEVEDLPTASQTRASRKESTSTCHKSAICDHAHHNNHIINWGGIDTVDRESNRLQRQIRESISIRQCRDNTMNRDEGSYELSKVWDCVIPTMGGGAPGRTSSKLAATVHQVAAVPRKMADPCCRNCQQ